MRKFFGALCMLLGLALLAGAAWLLMENRAEESAAGDAAGEIMSEMRVAMEDALTVTVSATPRPELGLESTPAPEATIIPQATPIPEMPTMEIDGQTYIGMVEVPSLELSLPVISEWTYPRLKKAPCRYVGSVYSKDMVICGHNYDRHFGRLKDLAVGDEVRFTDMDGNVFFYSVCGTEQLGKYAVEDMLAGEWDLTLFTCTKGGRMRVTVRCKLERYAVGEGQEEAQTAQ